MSGKKRPKCFFVISPMKLGQLWWNLVHNFLNKFDTKSCTRFPPRLNNVSKLPCETWNAHRTRVTIELLDGETPEFIQPQLWLPNSPDLNPVANSMWEILQEKCTKHASVICSYRLHYWRMAAAITEWHGNGEYGNTAVTAVITAGVGKGNTVGTVNDIR